MFTIFFLATTITTQRTYLNLTTLTSYILKTEESLKRRFIYNVNKISCSKIFGAIFFAAHRIWGPCSFSFGEPLLSAQKVRYLPFSVPVKFKATRLKDRPY